MAEPSVQGREIGSWAFSDAHGEPVRILDVDSVWNHTVYEVWIPRLAKVERVRAEVLTSTQSPITPASDITHIDRIAYAVCAARIADALTQDVLLAPLEAGVIPLPHQLYALTRAVGDDRIRYLLADEVGLGKTIEAGLIFRELKLRGLVNPMKIEQRIGRVDRIGQKLPVKAFNLIFEESVELRVQEVLEEKLATILVEFGVDKTEDVLDSAESGAIFEKLYAQAILNPGDIEKNIEKLIQEIREQGKQEVAGRSFYGETVLDPTLAQQLSSHPLPFWVEQMTTAYLRCEGGRVDRDLFSYSLEWPDGSRMERVSFHSRDAQDRGLQHVSVEDDRIRRLVQQLPRVVVSEPIPMVRLTSLPAEVVGYWSLWRIILDHRSFRDVKIIPIFHHDDGRILLPTARHIWDLLLEDRPDVELMGDQAGGRSRTPAGTDVEDVFRRLRSEAERHGEDAFHELHARHQQRLKREQEKGRYAFEVRRGALNRIGLPEVRQHRLKRLDEEEKVWAEDLRKREQVLPELQPVVLLRVEAGNG